MMGRINKTVSPVAWYCLFLILVIFAVPAHSQGQQPETASTEKASPNGEQTDDPKASDRSSDDKNSPVVGKEKAELQKKDNLSTFVKTSNFDVEIPSWFRSEVVTADDGAVLIPVQEFGFSGGETQKRFDSAVLSAAQQYVDGLLAPGAHRYVNLTLDELRDLGVFHQEETRKGTYLLNGSYEPTVHYFAHLKMDQQFQDHVEKIWVEQRQQHRLMSIGLVAGSVLLVLVVLFGSLRLNTATSGFYQGRLQFLGLLMILGIVVAGAWFGSRLDWI